MPRNITVTLANGATHTYQNAPDNITPEQVQQRAQKEFGQTVTAIDGGRGRPGPAAPKPTARPVVKTREQEIQEIARRNIDARRQQRKKAGITSITPEQEAMGAGIANFLGIGPIASAGVNFIGDVLSGRPTKFKRDLDIARAENKQLREQAPYQAFAGELVGGGMGGGAAVKGIQLAARGLQATKAARVGNFLQSATALKKGQTARNAARIVGGGAAGGGAQALGEGSDVSEGVITGAAGAAALGAGAKAVKGAYKGLRNLAGFEPVEEILAKYVKTPMADIQRTMQERARQGLPSSIYEVLPLGDRQALDDAIGKMPAAARERLASTVRQRAENMVGETTRRVSNIVRPVGPDPARAKIAADLARSRNAAGPTADEMALAERAARSPIEMRAVQEAEARNIMQPHDNVPAYENVSGLVPQAPTLLPNGSVQMTETNPEIGATIRRAAGVLRIKEDALTFRDVTRIMRHLSNQARRGGIEGDAAAQALNHIGDTLAEDHPNIAPAIEQMRTAWASRGRMMTGVQEGTKTRLRENVPVDSAEDARAVRQAYDTPEGSTGRALGQSAQLERDLMTSPQQSLRAMNRIATDPTAQRAISENLGNAAGENIAEVARMQTESARRLSGLDREAAQEAGADPVHMLQNLMMLSPNTLPATKALALSRLVKGAIRIPESQAQNLVDMLFSQNPTQISRAVTFLGRSGTGGQQVLREIGRDLMVGSLAAGGGGDGAGDGEGSPAPSIMVPPEDIPADTEAPGMGEMSQDQSPYAADLQAIYDSEDPELLDLFDRVEQQESGGDQSAVSSAGAIGVMQVMPGTAPEAAALAGLPWDEKAYHTDAIYNRLLGIAYLSEMLRRYDGDVEKALAAYNAGAGRVDEALVLGDDWLSSLPAETQDYVARIS